MSSFHHSEHFLFCKAYVSQNYLSVLSNHIHTHVYNNNDDGGDDVESGDINDNNYKKW